jgi:hypothetical protein
MVPSLSSRLRHLSSRCTRPHPSFVCYHIEQCPHFPHITKAVPQKKSISYLLEFASSLLLLSYQKSAPLFASRPAKSRRLFPLGTSSCIVTFVSSLQAVPLPPLLVRRSLQPSFFVSSHQTMPSFAPLSAESRRYFPPTAPKVGVTTFVSSRQSAPIIVSSHYVVPQLSSRPTKPRRHSRLTRPNSRRHFVFAANQVAPPHLVSQH